MRRSRSRAEVTISVVALAAVLGGCSGGSPSVTAGPTTATSAATTPAAVVTSAAGSDDGCPPGGAAVPSGAGTAKSADLDGDGRADRVWLADIDGKRTLGVRTASGAGFSRTFTSAAPQTATALAARVGTGTGPGTDAVVLLDTGRSVALYAVVDCRLVESRNAQGEQYTFDRGFTGYGTGVGCPSVGGTPRLAGYLAETDTGASYRVTRTTVDLTAGGAKATNGEKTTLGTTLKPTSTDVVAATGVTCGKATPAHEPS
ncbi:hypothetical protein ACIB24_15770 [Spongisporangium articulatum]|uniref:VCBS repeat-containing protein n=1 Tax=Spongisporangium articulatum TaxID=3362603 RepID=A0ABW8ASG4_9ACTN